MSRKNNMKVKELIKELKTYDGETDFAVKLVVDPHDSKKDISLKWIGEIDTSLLDQGYIEFGVERMIMSSEKTKVLKLDKPKKQYVETYQELNILATINGHIDLWHKHYPFKKWITHKYFPEVDMDNDDFPEGIFGEDDFCDQELIQEWIDDTHQPFKLISMPDQKGFYFYVSENNIISTDKNKTDTNEVWSIDKGKWISLD